MCSSYRDLSAHSGGVAGLVLTCRSVLKNQDTESDRNVSGGGLFLLPRQSDQARHPGYKTSSTMVKQVQQDHPLCRQIPIGAAHISFSGHTQIGQAMSKTNPRVSPRWPRRLPSSDQHSEEHWPGGAKIMMTLGQAYPREIKG